MQFLCTKDKFLVVMLITFYKQEFRVGKVVGSVNES